MSGALRPEFNVLAYVLCLCASGDATRAARILRFPAIPEEQNKAPGVFEKKFPIRYYCRLHHAL
jgi:hypothetical protein